MEQDRRRAPRFTLHQVVRVELGQEDFINARGVDISEKGVRCVVQHCLDPYTRVFLMLQLDENDEDSLISCHGVVNRCGGEGLIPEDIAVEFTEIQDSDREKIRRYLAGGQ